MPRVVRVGTGLALAVVLSVGGLWSGQGRAFAEPYRLGFSGREVTGTGVRVVSVTPGSPATKLYKVGGSAEPFTLVSGDVVVAVDGTPVRSLADYFKAMGEATPGKVVITVREASTGRATDWTTERPTPPADGNQPPDGNSGRPSTLYLVIVADTNAENIGRTVEVDRENVELLFRLFVPPRQLRITKVSGNQVNPRNVLRVLKAQGANGMVAGRDTLVFYYSGHGAYNQRAGDHVLTTSGGDLFLQRDVEATAKQLRPRVTVMLSDACSVLLPAEPSVGAPSIEPPTRVAPAFASLFFDLPPGVVAISAAMKGQAAGCDINGGFFTIALCEYLASQSERRLDWPAVLKEINRNVQADHPATRQTAYIIGAGSPDPAPRFGVTAQATERSRKVGGVEVTHVMQGYPGTAMKRPGDDQSYYLAAGRHIITHVNGERVRNYAEFVNAVRNSPTEMVVTVYDPVKDTTRDYETTLRD